MNQMVTVGSLFHEAQQLGWNGCPLTYSEEELNQQILILDEDDHNETLEIHRRICLGDISYKRKDNLFKQLSLKTGQTKKEIETEVKHLLSKKSTQQEIVTLVVQSLGKGNLVHATGIFHLYKKGCWIPQIDMAIRSCIQSVCDCNDVNYTKALVDGVIGLLKALVFVPGNVFDIQHPSINCLNGEVGFDSDGHPALYAHDREHYHLAQIPVEYDPDTIAPRFEQYLDEIFAGCSDIEERTLLILEFIGYSLLTTNKLERFIILLGSGSNGKSVLLAILERLLGKSNVCSISPSKLGERFISAQLLGKLANIVTEIAVGEKIDDAKIKSMVSGELLTAERKGKDHFEFRPHATMWFATNHMPHTRDYTPALFRRAEIITFTNTFEGKSKDTGLIDKLAEELPGIFNLALNAIADALKRTDFTQCPSSQKAKKEWRIESDQVALFVEECCEPNKHSKVPVGGLYKHYEYWSDEEGIKLKLGKNNFSQRLEALGFLSKKIGPIRYKVGIQLKK